MRLSICLLWLTVCVFSGCDERRPSLMPVEGGVVCSGLVLEIDDARGGARSVIRAERAVFDDLPGRGRGQLDSVEVRVSSVGEEERGFAVVTARAKRAIVGPGGSVRLDEATVSGGETDAFFMTASTVRVKSDGALEAEGVRATLRSP